MDNFYIYELYRLASLTLPVAVAALLAWLVLRQENRKFTALVLLLMGFLAILYFVQAFGERYDAGRFGYGRYSGWFQVSVVVLPLLLTSVISTIVGILLAFRLFRPYVLRPEDPTAYSDPVSLRDAVSKIFDSESFLTALRAALPQGKEDQQYGLDYIPYMLHSVDERRRRAVRSARLFLLTTVGAALIFSSVVMYFGYILVNEGAAGTAKSLADLKGATQKVSDTLPSIVPSYYNNPKFQREVSPALERLSGMDPGAKNTEVQDKIRTALDQAKSTGDFAAISVTLTQARDAVSREGKSGQEYATAVADGADRLSEFVNAQSSVVSDLANRTRELKVLISKAEDTLSKPENRTPEIIKRLALGLVISTFFLALLRYLGTLYRTRYLQVLEAEKDDFAVRRFYVAFKSSLSSDEQRKAVLTSFMASPNGMGGPNAKESPDDTTKQEFEVIKELVQALSKKL